MVLKVKTKQKSLRMLLITNLKLLKTSKKQNFMLVLTKKEGIFCTKFDFTVKGEGDVEPQKLSKQMKITEILLLKS